MAWDFMGVSVRRGRNVDGDFAGGEKGLHDEGGNRRDERAHDRPLGRLGLPLLDIPGGGDNHREGPEVGDASQNAHPSSDRGVEAAGGLSEEKAAAIEKESSPEKIRIHGHDCTMSPRNAVTRYRPANADLVSDYYWAIEIESIWSPENGDLPHALPAVKSNGRGGAAAARPSLSCQMRMGGGQRGERRRTRRPEGTGGRSGRRSERAAGYAPADLRSAKI
jgi:hypothetical protein